MSELVHVTIWCRRMGGLTEIVASEHNSRKIRPDDGHGTMKQLSALATPIPGVSPSSDSPSNSQLDPSRQILK